MLHVGAESFVPGDILAPLLILAGVLVLGFVLARALRPRPSGRIEPAQHPDPGRRLAARLDERATRLEILICRADERIAALSRVACDEADSCCASEPDPVPSAGKAARVAWVSEADPCPSEPDPRTRAIYDLADSGRSTVEIARQLHEQIGRVELILALRDQGSGSALGASSPRASAAPCGLGPCP